MQEKVSIKGIAAVIHRPKKRSDKLAILCPGYLDTKDYAHLVTLADDLAARGYTAVRFDPTGTWGSSGTIEQYNTTQYLLDISRVLEFMLQERSYAHVLIGGHSRGGIMSLLFAAREKKISAVVAVMPSSGRSLKDREIEWRKNAFEISFRDIPGSSGRREYRVPYSHVEDRKKYDVHAEVSKIHASIAFIAGEIDTQIPPEDVQSLFDKANDPKAISVVSGIGHDYRLNGSEIAAVNKEIFQLLGQLKVIHD